jgi:UDP-3-O-[3-hydroxymyristoyl] N-acetylglucosamine deacetylase|nr:UDP-3-O-acyl-N-acetylglucosamine deacetylase [Neorhizobium tomejilense]
MTKSMNIRGSVRSTVMQAFALEGVGLHSGQPSSVFVTPGSAGIRVADGDAFHVVSSLEVARTPRCTRLVLPSGRQIDMVEHLFAALRIAGITDADIVFIGDEVPVLDGSSSPWLRAFSSAGTRPVTGSADCLVVTAPVELVAGQSRFRVTPGAFEVTCTIDFPNPHIGHQKITVAESDLFELANARTFAMEHEIEMLKAHNLALGGSLDNAVVVGDRGPLNPEGFRMPDECVRHKTLDFIGDLMVLGVPVIGRFEIHAPGHAANNAFVEAIVASGHLRRVSVVVGDQFLLAA